MSLQTLPQQILQQVYGFAKSAQRARFPSKLQVLRQFTVNEFMLMMALCRAEDEEKPVTMSDASRMLGISRPAITQLALRLCKKGCIERVRDENDRRIIYLRLTRQAKKAAQAEYEKQIAFTERFVNAYGAEKSEQFLHMLYEIYDVFKKLISEEEMK